MAPREARLTSPYTVDVTQHLKKAELENKIQDATSSLIDISKNIDGLNYSKKQLKNLNEFYEQLLAGKISPKSRYSAKYCSKTINWAKLRL